MGYRSDVRIITSKKGFDELKKITDKILKDKNIKYGNLDITLQAGSKAFLKSLLKTTR